MLWLGECHAWAIHVPVVPASSKAVVCFEHGSVLSLPQHLVEHRFWLQSAGGVWKHGGDQHAAVCAELPASKAPSDQEILILVDTNSYTLRQHSHMAILTASCHRWARGASLRLQGRLQQSKPCP